MRGDNRPSTVVTPPTDNMENPTNIYKNTHFPDMTRRGWDSPPMKPTPVVMKFDFMSTYAGMGGLWDELLGRSEIHVR